MVVRLEDALGGGIMDSSMRGLRRHGDPPRYPDKEPELPEGIARFYVFCDFWIDLPDDDKLIERCVEMGNDFDDILFAEVQKEIDREVVRSILGKEPTS